MFKLHTMFYSRLGNNRYYEQQPTVVGFRHVKSTWYAGFVFMFR